MQKNIFGYAIFLTNDRTYWNQPKKKQIVDVEFRIHDGKKISGLLKWRDDTSEGTMRGRKEAINIIGNYKLWWDDDFEHAEKKYGKFKYLLVKVAN